MTSRSLVIGVFVLACLPFVAIIRGLALIPSYDQGASIGQILGLTLSFTALFLGALFFAFSIRYYLATFMVLIGSFGLIPGMGNGREKPNGNGNGSGHSTLSRIMHRSHVPTATADLKAAANGRGHVLLEKEPFICVQIASYNEKRVIGRLLEACSKFEYQNYEVLLVDDSTDESKAVLAKFAGNPRFKILHRPTRSGYKGGALELALDYMDPRTEFVAIFDADALPFPDALQRFLPHFYVNGDGKPPRLRRDVAAVQSYQWHVLNKSESWLTEAVRAEYSGSYMIERPFQEAMGAMKMVAGTAYMIRAEVLKRMGWGRSITEDWEMTLRLYLKGYKVVYTPYAETPAECVGTFGRLVRQRMRWAEGHCYNVRKWFLPIMVSPRLSTAEKLEFAYFSVYYLQAVFLMVGSLAWMVAEIGFKVRIPMWTSTLGWSLLFSNLFALPLMNVGGLLLEQAPKRDMMGVFGAIGLSYMLVPFQAWASLKGFFEHKEGPWYRTPKTGRVTDEVSHLGKFKRLSAWLYNRRRRLMGLAAVAGSVVPTQFRSLQPLRRHSPAHWAWMVIFAMVLSLGGLGVAAWNAPGVKATGGTQFYLHNNNFMDGTASSGTTAQTVDATTVGSRGNWSPGGGLGSSQTVLSSSTFDLNYWTTGNTGSATADLNFWYDSGCGVIAHIDHSSDGSTNNTGQTSGDTGTNYGAGLQSAASVSSIAVTVRSVRGGDLLVALTRKGSSLTVSDGANTG
ncbi:MAG TPA: glycosyltransferase family 2 protein, partial [Candidatus Dormibacteraeota bacterium]|nr:glycosyltransferase family 2 protein [Candidatus Dormibacteraeota bacterium]